MIKLRTFTENAFAYPTFVGLCTIFGFTPMIYPDQSCKEQLCCGDDEHKITITEVVYNYSHSVTFPVCVRGRGWGWGSSISASGSIPPHFFCAATLLRCDLEKPAKKILEEAYHMHFSYR
jgi:hypothetical protein